MAPRIKSPEERAERVKASQRKYREKNREKLRAGSLARYYADADNKRAVWRQWYAENRESHLSNRRAYYIANRDEIMEKTLCRQRKRKYGLTSDDVAVVVEAQGGKCPICADAITAKKGHVDHDHATGELRGVLCGNCNLGLGHFRDNVRLLEEAMRYLSASVELAA